jgi:hypothetical protein
VETVIFIFELLFVLLVGYCIWTVLSNIYKRLFGEIKWEYLIIPLSISGGDDIIIEINKYGEQGWEMITVEKLNENTRYHFKRRKKE